MPSNQWGEYYSVIADPVTENSGTSANFSAWANNDSLVKNVPEGVPSPATFNSSNGVSSTQQALAQFQPPI
jgi:hypothetical protein